MNNCSIYRTGLILSLGTLSIITSVAQAAALLPGTGVFTGIGLESGTPPGSSPASYLFAESEFSFSASITGPNLGDISGIGLESASNVFSGKYWSVNVSVTADNGAFDDNISVSWTASHINVPSHPSDGVGSNFTGLLQNDGSEDSITKFYTPPSTFIVVGHGPHKDYYTSSLASTVVSTGPFDAITTWTWAIEGEHLPKKIPEPAGLALLGLGLFALGRFKRWG